MGGDLDTAECVFLCYQDRKKDKGNCELHLDLNLHVVKEFSPPTPKHSFSSQWLSTRHLGTIDLWHQLEFQFIKHEGAPSGQLFTVGGVIHTIFFLSP